MSIVPVVPVFIFGCEFPDDVPIVLGCDVPDVEPVVPFPFGVAIPVPPCPAPLPPAPAPAPPPPAPCASAAPENPKINAETNNPFVEAGTAVSLTHQAESGATSNAAVNLRRNRHANTAQRVRGSSAYGTTPVNAYRFYEAEFKGT